MTCQELRQANAAAVEQGLRIEEAFRSANLLRRAQNEKGSKDEFYAPLIEAGMLSRAAFPTLDDWIKARKPR